MSDELTANLLFTAVATGAVALLLAARDLPLIVALLIVILRFAIPVTYFAWYFDGTWTFLDDVAYFADGSELLHRGYNPLSILIEPGGIDVLCSLAGGHHIAYTWWNLAAQYLFGEHYYAPCFMNVLLTFVSASFFGKTLALLGIKRSYCIACQAFMLLHWDIVAWSSLMNAKDSLVQFLTVVVLFCAVGFVRTRKARFAAGFVFVWQLFYWLRFYVPFLVLASVCLWMVTQWHDFRKYLIVPLVLLGCYAALPLLGEFDDYMDFTAIGTGALRFVLTPQPWSLESGYSFLFIPSLLHWICIVPSLYGGWMLWRESSLARLFLIYMAVIIVFYAVTEELLGPRQRLQLSFIFAWTQFHFLWQMQPSKRRLPLPLQSVAVNTPQSLAAA